MATITEQENDKNIKDELSAIQDNDAKILTSSDANSNVPFKIPNIFSYLDKSKDSTFYRPISPVPPAKKSESTITQPEFNFALLDPTAKVLESSFSTNSSTSNARSLQSEIFESQGHFNASRSCSPFPIYVPKYEPPPPQTGEKTSPTEEKPSSKMIIEPVKPKDPKYEEHMKKVALLSDKDKGETIMLQKGCFNEFKEKRITKNQKTIEHYSGPIQIQVENDLSKTEKPTEIDDDNIIQMRDVPLIQNGIELQNTTDLTNKLNETSIEDVKQSKPEMEISSTTKKEDETSASTQNTVQENTNVSNESKQSSTTDKTDDKTKKPDSLPLRNEPEPRKFKKAPETIIGAKPVFGQLNINNEFQQAIIGRQQAIQAKRLKQASENVTRSETEPKVKVEKTETETQEKIGHDSKLATEVKNTEVAEVEMFYPSENEEIEKINYAQEREVHIDFQKVGDEIIFPPNLPIEPQSFSSFQEFIQNQYEEHMQSSDQFIDTNVESDQEEYRKIPVRSLIQSFEQSVKPQIKYKQLRDPLPDVVEKLMPSQKYNLSSSKSFDSFNESINKIQASKSDQTLQRSEEMLETSRDMSATMYHIANVEVKTQYFPPDQSRMQLIEPSENSSFCKYISPSSSVSPKTNETFQSTEISYGQDEGKISLCGFFIIPCRLSTFWFMFA